VAKKDQDKAKKTAPARKVKPAGGSGKAAKPAKAGRPAKRAPSADKGHPALHAAGRKLADLASSPVVAEVVAATLVAAAAALRDPKQARSAAKAARDELSAVGKQAVGKSGAFWNLALDVAKRSMDAIDGDSTDKKKGKPQAKK
jgi:hypothetical protein